MTMRNMVMKRRLRIWMKIKNSMMRKILRKKLKVKSMRNLKTRVKKR
jgi:hypothetical protein